MTLVDDYGHHPSEVAATIAAMRERVPGAAPARALPAAPLLAHPPPRAGARPGAGAADDVAVTEIYAAREQPVEGVSGKLVVDATAERQVRAGWMPSWRTLCVRRGSHAARGRRCSSIGAGDVDRAPTLLEAGLS